MQSRSFTRLNSHRLATLVEPLESRQLLSGDPADLLADGFEVIEWNGQTAYAVPDQWIVKVNGPRGSSDKQLDAANGLLQGAGIAVADLHAKKHLGTDGLFVMRSNNGKSFTSVKQLLQKVKGLQLVEPDFAVWIDATIPNDPQFATNQYALNNTGQAGGTVDADIDAPEAWDVTTGAGGGVVVGVVDTGIDYNHPDLAANMWTNPGETAGNGIDDDDNGFIDDVYGWNFYSNTANPLDDNGHGTHVSGTIAAVGNNGVGVAGVSWGAKLMALKFLSAGGSGSTSGAVAAINYATMMRSSENVNIRLTNNSWGGGGFSSALFDAINSSGAAGMLFVAAAGNSGINSDASPQYPASYALDNIISVAATSRTDGLASWSNYGSASVDLGAPGVDIVSTYRNNSYATLSGTSMASPHVAGVAALAWAVSSGATYPTVRNAILSGVDSISSLAGKTVTGGRLNAARTLALLATPAVAPTAPSALAGSVVSSSQINLSWADNSNNETGFRVFRSTNGTTFSQVATVGAGATSYNNTGLTASTTYWYLVRAYNAAGDSGNSNTISRTTQAAPAIPNAPSGLGASALSTSQIRLTWTDNSSNETGFKIERSRNGTSWSQIATVGANVLTYTNSGLKKNTTFYYRVRAYNGVGNSAYSNVASTRTFASGSVGSIIESKSLFSTTAIASPEDDELTALLR